MSGHFRLSSGRHSGEYCQCARVLEDPGRAEELGAALAGLFEDTEVDIVVSPALGGVIIGHEVARALGVRSFFAERRDGKMTLRRGFLLEPDERVLIVEDVVTTGGSVREVAEVVGDAGARVVGFGFLVDRSSGDVDLGAPMRALVRRNMPSYEPERCPLCDENRPLTRPGSRPG
ncbi:MAG: orotate phosphoribosyltransferase [Candidatus Eisenbacteria bacterium]|nr:orotate phosphoribosyltransferase [Candidatus Eisenbacteria bacterium]